MFNENKHEIVKALAQLLKLTRAGQDIADITFEPVEEIATVVYLDGSTERVNVFCDSGIAMIRDILAVI